MSTCRAVPVIRLPVTDGAAQAGIGIPADAVSLVIHNPSWAALLIRWSATAVDPTDSRSGYDLAIIGPTLSSIPIPVDAQQLSVAWGTPVWTGGAHVIVDTTGADVITIEATKSNQGVFIGLLSTATPPLVGG
jgi:hypothetical protein